ncbi:hypothetical protein PGQ11_002832 [Apiospora arundinis]|uniref:Uncharacterized protein n=1 Tax=Apiospora arundinis TaxID=335852 RepID=A0ABR2J448_9PEZI
MPENPLTSLAIIPYTVFRKNINRITAGLMYDVASSSEECAAAASAMVVRVVRMRLTEHGIDYVNRRAEVERPVIQLKTILERRYRIRDSQGRELVRKVMIPIPNKERCLSMHAVFCARCSMYLYKQIEVYECNHTVADMQKHATMAENEYGIKATPTYKIMDRNSISKSTMYLRTSMIVPYHMNETIRGIRGAFANETLTQHRTYGPFDDFVMIGIFIRDPNPAHGYDHEDGPSSTTSDAGDWDTAPDTACGLYAHMQRNANQNLAENMITKRVEIPPKTY